LHRRHAAGQQVRADQQPVLAKGGDDGQLGGGLIDASDQSQHDE